MAFSSIPQADIGPGSPLTQSLFQKIKDNDDYLKAQADTLAFSSSIPNGSLETDSDVDGVPDNWTRNLFNGGSGALSASDFVFGTRAYKFSRIADAGGNTYGGGSLTSEYVECSFLELLNFGIAFRASSANIINGVYIRFYDKDKIELSTGYWYTNGTGRELWKKSGAMPTTWAWLCILNVGVPNTAKYYKLAFHAGIPDVTHTYASAADIFIDRITASPQPVGHSVLLETIDQAEVSIIAGTWSDVGSTYSIIIPAGMKFLDVSLQVKSTYSQGYNPAGRIAIGTNYGTTVNATDDSQYHTGVSRLNVSSLSGGQILKFQAMNLGGNWWVYLKSSAVSDLKYYVPVSITVDFSLRTVSEVL